MARVGASRKRERQAGVHLLVSLAVVLLGPPAALAGPFSGVVSGGGQSVRLVHDAGGGRTAAGGTVCQYTLGSPVAGRLAASPRLVIDGLAAYLVGMHDTAPPSAFALITPAAGAETTATVLTFTWSAATDSSFPVSYRVIVDTDMVGAYVVDSTVTGQTTLTASVAASETYSWRVIAADARGCSRSVGDSVFRVYALTAPAPLSPIGGACTTWAVVQFRWASGGSSGPALQDYRLQLSRNDTTFASPVVDVYHAAATTDTTTSYRCLAADTYCWRVQARDLINNVSMWSATETFVKTTEDKAADFNLDGVIDFVDLRNITQVFGVPGMYDAAYDIGAGGPDGRIDAEDIFELGRRYGQ